MNNKQRVARLIIYEGEPRDIADQLGRSMPDGIKKGKVEISIITLGQALPLTYFIDGSKLNLNDIDIEPGKFNYVK